MDYKRIITFSFAPVIYARIVVFRMMMDFRSCDEVLFSGAGLWLLLVLSHLKTDLSGRGKKRKGQQKKAKLQKATQNESKLYSNISTKSYQFRVLPQRLFHPTGCKFRCCSALDNPQLD